MIRRFAICTMESKPKKQRPFWFRSNNSIPLICILRSRQLIQIRSSFGFKKQNAIVTSYFPSFPPSNQLFEKRGILFDSI